MDQTESTHFQDFHLHGIRSDGMQKEGLSSGLSNTFLLIDLLILIPVCYLHYMIKRMFKREKGQKGHTLIKKLLNCYSNIVPVTFICCFVFVHLILLYTSPPCMVFGDGFCYVYQIFAHSGSIYIGGFSMFCAVAKYWFIVHNVKSRQIGEERAITIFTLIYCTVPVSIATLNSLSHGNRDQMMWVNMCWGIKPSDVTGTFDFFCHEKEYDTAKYVGIDVSAFLIPLQRVICGGVNILYALIFTNIVEFIIYYRIFSYLNR